jgi:predicted helicase
LDIFDYIYGVLHEPAYRTKYQEFLKIDFPRVPYPKDADEFEQYIRIGSRLRKLHLLEAVPTFQTAFPISGTNAVNKVRFADSKVFINETQYFKGVPTAVWEFFVGGSCPAQKYLKDRKNRVMTSEEVQHYQKIVAVLNETILVQKSQYGSKKGQGK